MIKLEAVAEKCSDAIAAERWVHTFGAGHSSIPGMETFPRIGSFVGFHQLNELNLSFNGQVVGGMAQRQSSFLERVEGYAEIILANHRFSPQDVAILFSNSGINELIVDMALLLKEKGVTVVGLTSIAHSMSNQPRHSSGKRLSEVVDISIDTCCPEGRCTGGCAWSGLPRSGQFDDRFLHHHERDCGADGRLPCSSAGTLPPFGRAITYTPARKNML